MSYPTEFNDALRERVKSRDGYMCYLCGMTEQQSEVRFGQGLSVHHKDENKQNSDPSNLVTLCKSCHQRTHWNREIIV